MSFNKINEPQRPGNTSPAFSSESGSSTGEHKNGIIPPKPDLDYSEENFKKNNGYPGESDDEVLSFEFLENGGRFLRPIFSENKCSTYC